MKKKWYLTIICGVILLFIFMILILKTGAFLSKNIDKRDLAFWEYNENGFIEGTDEFYLEGKKDICWLMIHGYTSTPRDMEYIAKEINNEFSDYVFVPRLKGHSRVPSGLFNLSLDDWYSQIEESFDNLSSQCGRVNIVGFSLGGSISIKLSEEKNISRTYLISPFVKIKHHWYYVFSPKNYLNLFGDFLIYFKKSKVSYINDPKGLEDYIAYWNFPLLPVKNSLDFLEEMKSMLFKIENPILIQHSKGDFVCDFKGGEFVYEKVSSVNKEIILFEKSNHVLLVDYDKEEVISNIIKFEMNFRN
jgi:carboxylesterase